MSDAPRKADGGGDLARPTPREPKPKVIVLRQTVRSVRPEDEPTRAAFRLGLTCACAAGAIAVVWVLGHIGFRLGAAPALGVPELLAEPGEGLATGTAALLRMPLAIFRLAVHEPLLIVLAFAALSIPAAGLAATRPLRPGGPPPRPGITALATIAATMGLAIAVALVAWTLSPWREAALMPLPSETAALAEWADAIDRIAGVDTLAMIVLVLWCVLIPRLPTPRWLTVLAMVLALFASAIVLVGTAISTATAAHAHLPRSVVRLDTGATATLVGYTRGHVVLLRDVDGTAMIALVESADRMMVTDRISISALGRTQVD